MIDFEFLSWCVAHQRSHPEIFLEVARKYYLNKEFQRLSDDLQVEIIEEISYQKTLVEYYKRSSK